MDIQNDSISRPTGSKRQPKGLIRRLPWFSLLVLISLLIAGLSSQPAASQEPVPRAPSAPMPVWTIKTVDGPRYFTNMTDRSMAYRRDGTPCAAYGADGLYFSCYNSASGLWEAIVLDSSVGVGQYASLTFFFNPLTMKEEAFIAYFDATNSLTDGLKLKYTINGVWQPSKVVPTPAPLYLHTEISGGPTAELVPEGDIDFLAEARKVQLPSLGFKGQADPNFIIQNPLGVGKYTSIAADPNGIYISYYDDRVKPGGTTMESERNLKFARWKGGNNWYFKVVDNYLDQGAVGLWSSMKVDSNSNIHIAYFDEKYDNLKYAFWDQKDDDMIGDDGWWTSTVDGEGGPQAQPNAGSMCSLDLFDRNVVGVRGVPYISYLDFTKKPDGSPNGNLRLAKLVEWKGQNSVWGLKTIDSAGITGWWSSIKVNSANDPPKVHISYYNPSKGDLMYATGRGLGEYSVYRVKTGVWGDGQFTSIDLNPANNQPGILHYNAPEGKMEFTYRYSPEIGNKWASLLVDYNGHDVGFNSSLAVSNTNIPHISYFNSTFSSLKYARPFGPTAWWKWNIMGDPHSGLYSSIALYNSAIRIGAYDSTNSNLIQGMYGDRSGWEFQTIDDTYDKGEYVSLKVDSIGRTHVSYYDATHGDLIYADWGVHGNFWYTDTHDSNGDVGKYTSLALSSDNRVYISYFDESKKQLKLRYQLPPFGAWDTVVVDDGGILEDEVGWYTSIDLDGSDNPHISYYNITTGDLKFASSSDGGATFNLSTVDSTGDVGRFSSLKINRADNTRHVCYYDLTNGDLRYARYSGSWEFDIVDSDGDVGASCSIALSVFTPAEPGGQPQIDAGQPIISYYDNSRADLKIAYSFPLPYMKLYFPVIER